MDHFSACNQFYFNQLRGTESGTGALDDTERCFDPYNSAAYEWRPYDPWTKVTLLVFSKGVAIRLPLVSGLRSMALPGPSTSSSSICFYWIILCLARNFQADSWTSCKIECLTSTDRSVEYTIILNFKERVEFQIALISLCVSSTVIFVSTLFLLFISYPLFCNVLGWRFTLCNFF